MRILRFHTIKAENETFRSEFELNKPLTKVVISLSIVKIETWSTYIFKVKWKVMWYVYTLYFGARIIFFPPIWLSFDKHLMKSTSFHGAYTHLSIYLQWLFTSHKNVWVNRASLCLFNAVVLVFQRFLESVYDFLI